jgi:hypothetical protein
MPSMRCGCLLPCCWSCDPGRFPGAGAEDCPPGSPQLARQLPNLHETHGDTRGRADSPPAVFPRASLVALAAGGAVARATCEAGRAFANVGSIGPAAPSGGLRPADERPQRLVVRTFLLTLGQRLRVDRPEPRPAARSDDGDHDLQAAGSVEHDPVKRGASARDMHELTYDGGLHNPSLSRSRSAPADYRGEMVARPLRNRVRRRVL